MNYPIGYLTSAFHVGHGWRERSIVLAISGARRNLIGREHELAVLNELLTSLGEGASGVLLVTGEPGIGKTAILSEGIEGAAGLGHGTLSGRGAEFERDLPFGVFAEVLEDQLQSQSARSDDRHTRLRAARAALAGFAQDRPLVLALDDLHWADEASMDLVCHLLHKPLAEPVLLLLAVRRGQAPARLETAMTEAERRHRAQRIELLPLSAAEAQELLGVTFDRDLAQRLYVESGGNPFYLEKLGVSSRAAAASIFERSRTS